MPKDTFFNLSEEKRNRIIDASMDEFSEYQFNDATVSRIVKSASIAKGSFYQYFEDKYDLFVYLIRIIGDIKKTYLSEVFTNMKEENFFDILKKMYKAGLEFAIDHPKYVKLALIFVKTADYKLKKRVLGEFDEDVEDFFLPLVNTAIEKGELRPDLDKDLFCYTLGQLSFLMSEYYFNKNKNDKINEDYLPMLENMINMFRYGVEIKKD